ncbi:MAG: acyltransferase, partial [Hymenobacter sp.]
HNQAALATNSSDRFVSVDVLRGIAIIMVVAGHANRGAMEEHIGSAAIAKWLDWFFYSLHMPIFFYLAGFFSYRSLKKTSRSQYIISRVRYIVAPYIIWSLIAVLASIIMSRLTSIRHPLSINDILNIAWKPINILWFLYAIFLFQITAAIFYSKPTYTLIAATVSGCGLWLYGAAGSQELEARILNQAPFFFVGFVAAKYFKRALWAPHRQTVLIIIISLTFFAAMMSARSLGITTPVQFVTLPISAAGIFGGHHRRPFYPPIRFPRMDFQ